jgi:hypothetical protein
MGDETFLAFIRNSAQKYDLEALDKAVSPEACDRKRSRP